MAGVKITALPPAASAQLTDVFPIDGLPGPVTYKLSNSQLLSLFQANMVASITGTVNQVIASSPTGAVTLSLPQSIATSSSPQFLAVKTPTILDAFGNNVFTFLGNAASVNWALITNSPTGQGPAFYAQGADTNVGMFFVTKGTGIFAIDSANTTTPLLINSGTALQHTTNFIIANTAATRNVTFQDASGTLAYLTDIPVSAMTWTTVTSSQAAVVFNGYVSNSAGALTFTLPVSANVGDVIAVEGLGSGGWILTANTGQTIKIGSGTTTSAGSLTSAAASDNVYVTCIVANTTWRVRSTNSAGLVIS